MGKEIIFFGKDYSPTKECYFVRYDVDPNGKRRINNEKVDKGLLSVFSDTSDIWKVFNAGIKTIDELIKSTNSNNKIQLIGGVNDSPDTVSLTSDDETMFGPYVGTVSCKVKVGRTEYSVKFVIGSRFDSFDQNRIEIKPFFLATLLLKGRIKLNDLCVSYGMDSLFDFYMLWLLQKHYQQASLKGYYRKYQQFESNTVKLRGSIDIARHIRLNAGMNNGRIACTYRENTIDNYLNHLLLSAYDYLMVKYPDIVVDNTDEVFLHDINCLKQEIGYPKYSRRELINRNLLPISHPFYFEYEQLRNDCLRIMRDEGLSPFDQEQESVSGVLYYIPTLWEEFLQEYFDERYYSSPSISVTAQDSKPILTPDVNSEHGISTMRPDFVFKSNESFVQNNEPAPFFVLDAKYKEKWKNELKGKQSLDKDKKWEYSNDYNKCIRDMASFMCCSSGVIFPVSEEEYKNNVDNWKLEKHISPFYRLGTFYTVPVVVPNAVDTGYSDWQVLMDKSVNNTLTIFCDRMDYELEVAQAYQDAMATLEKKIQKIQSKHEHHAHDKLSADDFRITEATEYANA